MLHMYNKLCYLCSIGAFLYKPFVLSIGPPLIYIV